MVTGSDSRGREFESWRWILPDGYFSRCYKNGLIEKKRKRCRIGPFLKNNWLKSILAALAKRNCKQSLYLQDVLSSSAVAEIRQEAILKNRNYRDDRFLPWSAAAAAETFAFKKDRRVFLTPNSFFAFQIDLSFLVFWLFCGKNLRQLLSWL